MSLCRTASKRLVRQRVATFWRLGSYFSSHLLLRLRDIWELAEVPGVYVWGTIIFPRKEKPLEGQWLLRNELKKSYREVLWKQRAHHSRAGGQRRDRGNGKEWVLELKEASLLITVGQLMAMGLASSSLKLECCWHEVK